MDAAAGHAVSLACAILFFGVITIRMAIGQDPIFGDPGFGGSSESGSGESLESLHTGQS